MKKNDKGKTYPNVLFRTRNLGQHSIDISKKKNDVNQPLVSLINDNY
jgi:hypothetical protein